MKAVGEALKKAAGKPVPVPVPGPSEPSIEKPAGILPLPFEIWLGFPEGFRTTPYQIGMVRSIHSSTTEHMLEQG